MLSQRRSVENPSLAPAKYARCTEEVNNRCLLSGNTSPAPA